MIDSLIFFALMLAGLFGLYCINRSVGSLLKLNLDADGRPCDTSFELNIPAPGVYERLAEAEAAVEFWKGLYLAAIEAPSVPDPRLLAAALAEETPKLRRHIEAPRRRGANPRRWN